MFTDLSDGQLTRDKIRIFTNAHGGLLRSLPSSEFVSVFPGQTQTVSITHEFQENTKSAKVNKISGPDWVTVEDEKLIIAPSSEQTDYGDFTVKLESSVDGVALGRTNEVVVSLLKKVVLVSGELGSAGGIIENEWQDISISVEAGKLSQTYQIEYNAGLTTNGKLSLWTIITPEMNAEEMSYIELKQPSLDSIKINYLQQSEDSQSRNLRNTNDIYTSFGINAECSPDKTTEMQWFFDESKDGIKFPYVWQGFVARFDSNVATGSINGGEPRIAPSYTGLILDADIKCASALRSEFSDSLDILGKEAVLFVHGFIRSGKLGGVDKGEGEIKGEYFGKFPKIVKDAGYLPFIFQWRTNAKFETVADELGLAIKKITERTGKKVHIVSHSFGGLLSRALIQGQGQLSTDFAEKNVASLTTVGTPHSGIFDTGGDTINGVEFSEGTHGFKGDFISGCRAITCYQAGENVSLNKKITGLNDQSYGEFIVNLINAKYPNIPTQILIGLVPQSLNIVRNKYNNSSGKRDYKVEYDFLNDGVVGRSAAGDKLISIFGQRYKADGDNNDLDPLYRSPFINEYILPMDNRSYMFTYGDDDDLTSKYSLSSINNDWSDNNYREDVPFNDLKYFSEGFYHTTGSYGLDGENVDPPENGFFDFDKKINTYKNTEVGLHGCSSNTNCNHSTWNYFNYFSRNNPAQDVNPPSEIVVSGSVEYTNANGNNSSISFPVEIDIYHEINGIRTILDSVQLEDDGTYRATVAFVANTAYMVEAKPQASGSVRSQTSNKITTQATLAESNLNFPVITLIDNTPLKGDLVIQVKDGTSGVALNGFNVSVLNRVSRNLTPDGSNKNSGYTVEVLQGSYTVEISKDGYISGSKDDCHVVPNTTTTCIINIVSNAQIADGEITAVLSWGANPSDLDSHLVRKTNGTQDYHVYYGSKTGVDANLDRDDTSSYGPETITIDSVNQNSVYTYYIYNFSGGEDTVLPQSGAKVELNLNGTQRTFNVPNENGKYWKVFEIENGLILPCSTGCVGSSVDSIVRSLNRDGELFKNLPAKQ